MLASADNCLGITHVNFWGCSGLTDAAAIALAADKCRGITHVNFLGCSLQEPVRHLYAAVIALADYS